MVRTRLSANTTNKNSNSAFQGLVARFGTLKEGIGKGSVDWDAVRCAPQKEVFKAIERGGLADRKSKDIQAILQMAYEEKQERRAALTNPSDNPAGSEIEPESEKQEEISKAKQNIISLDHLHLLSTDDAISKMLTYPGIGPKTASCVALFCLQRPSFAVDTACSSSLAAINIACNALWQNDVDTAIAGGTDILTNPDMTAGLDRGHFLSRTGNCKTFDDEADGCKLLTAIHRMSELRTRLTSGCYRLSR